MPTKARIFAEDQTEWYRSTEGGGGCCKGLVEAFLCGSLCAATGCLCCLTTFGFILSIPLIVMGALYIDKCPAEPILPIYLIVGGVFWILSCCCNTCIQGAKKSAKDTSSSAIVGCIIMFFINIIFLTWFILGSVWIYRSFDSRMITDTDNYDFTPFCDKTLYLFAFWIQSMYFVVLGIVGICICFMCIFKCASA